MPSAALALSIVALVVTAVGWFVSYWLNARTQKRVLINSLTNEARITLTDAIREFYDWCVDIQSTIATTPMDDTTSLGQTADQHEARRRRL